MDQRTYDAAQQGLMASVGRIDPESRLERFLSELRSDPDWTDEQVAEVERSVRRLLRTIRLEPCARAITVRVRPQRAEANVKRHRLFSE